ncbi:MAG: hypothetical protein OER97_05175 [Gammaproteobacteria bacterium]|nr:hypothetical protein [Gammaproteobacteria bacterium]
MRFCLLLCIALLHPCFALAEPTDITVRVIARNAQYVGDLIDGAFVTITDAASGEMLAQGITSGNAGNPKRTMQTARKRGEPMAVNSDAKFVATLDIDEPRYLQVTAYGPLNNHFSANRASATQWIVPGKHISGGDGWVLELPGLLVAPNLAESSVSISKAARGIVIEAEVMLMCGCPIKPDFYWDPTDYEVVAIVRRGDDEVGRFPLDYAGAASEFETEITARLPGVYDVTVYAYDSASGNTGVGQIELTVTED